jgi:molybdopterin synthase catalytic subunit
MVELTELPIDTESLLRRAIHPDCGATLLFVGTTRRWTGGLETVHLEYQAYQAMARSELQRLEETARAKWPLKEVEIVHRLGEVGIGEISVAITVSSPHRHDAFEAGEWLIDELKRSVPIWKKENWRELGEAWVHPTAPMLDNAHGSEGTHEAR